MNLHDLMLHTRPGSGALQKHFNDAPPPTGAVRSITSSDSDTNCKRVLASLHQDSGMMNKNNVNGNWTKL